jgi:hypothetical protein
MEGALTRDEGLKDWRVVGSHVPPNLHLDLFVFAERSETNIFPSRNTSHSHLRGICIY